MKHNETDGRQIDVTRRDFLKGSSMATVMMMLGGVEIKAQDAKPAGGTQYKTTGAPLNCAVIGCGVWGREIIAGLGRLPNAPVVAICDTYEPFLRRSQEAAPKAATFTDYRQVLALKEVEGVFVATPTHQHREIVLAALKAGKHVYCEAPLAANLDDARAIAQAAKQAVRVNFQAGLQNRSDPQMQFLLSFIRTGAMGKTIKARAQWHKKQSWRRAASNPDRERDLNWRLQKDASSGLVGEIGIHQIDLASWIINTRPTAITGFGGVLQWTDGREAPDTIQAIVEYPGGVHLNYECTLANSFDASYEMYYGTDAALMIRDGKAWMFKEVDSPLLGWEVYARKDAFYKETGIALVANATKLAAQGTKPVDNSANEAPPALAGALEAFIANSKNITNAVEDFSATFDVNDTAALREYLATINKTKLPSAGYKEGFEAAVTVIKANEAIVKGQRVVFDKAWFDLG